MHLLLLFRNYRDRRAHNTKEISSDTLQNTLEYIKEHYDKDAEEITVCFYGGEALLAKKESGMDYI